MPHINIKHFPKSLTAREQKNLVAAISSAVKTTFGCEEDVISIALESIEQADWYARVYEPEIEGHMETLCKAPNY